MEEQEEKEKERVVGEGENREEEIIGNEDARKCLT